MAATLDEEAQEPGSSGLKEEGGGRVEAGKIRLPVVIVCLQNPYSHSYCRRFPFLSLLPAPHWLCSNTRTKCVILRSPMKTTTCIAGYRVIDSLTL